MSEEVFSRWQDLTIEQLRKKAQEAGESLSKIANKIIQERDLYKEVIEEVREYINHEWFKRRQLGIIDKSFQEWELNKLLQILDKAKEN